MTQKITIALILFSGVLFSQKKYVANKHFEQLAYVKSAELYKDIYYKGDHSILVMSRLADSYYFNMETEKSELWYSKLFKKHKNQNIDPEHYFRYSQSLKSNGKYKKSDSWLMKLKKIMLKGFYVRVCLCACVCVCVTRARAIIYA